MKNNIICLVLTWLFFSHCFFLEATSPMATPLVNGVNVLTGEMTVTALAPQCEYYQVGVNHVAGTSIQLASKDPRIGKVKSLSQIHEQTHQVLTIASFIYHKDHTEVFDGSMHKTIYRYNEQKLQAVENYLSQHQSHVLYRRERFFWDRASKNVVSRVLEDGDGQLLQCCVFSYNAKGLMTGETLYGNISGKCLVPLQIDSQGYPISNGVESYNTRYFFSLNDPELLIRKEEDNGTVMYFDYDPKTKQCVSKLKGDRKGIRSRQFYSFDKNGFLNRTIIDDGTGMKQDDLRGVNVRTISTIETHSSGVAIGQPSITEKRYFDLANWQEVVLERVLYSYSSKGELVRKEFYDGSNTFCYSVQMTYDDKGNLTSTIDSRGEKVEVPQESSQYRYDALSRQSAAIDKYGNETQYFYDDFGRLVKTIYPAVLDVNDREIHFTELREYDVRNNVIKSIDANGRVTETTYNIKNQPTRIIHPEGVSESFVYFLDGTLRESISKSGCKTIYDRDDFGRLLSAMEFSPSGQLLNSIYHTYKGAYLECVSDRKSYTTTFFYDGAGRQVAIHHKTKDGVKKREFDFDSWGQQVKTREWFSDGANDFVTKVDTKDANHQTGDIEIVEASGRVQKIVSAAGSRENDVSIEQEHTTRNSRGQYARQMESVRADGSRTIVTYDAMGRLEQLLVLDPLGGKLTEKDVRYDGLGNKIKESHSVLSQGKLLRTYTILWTYNSANRVTSIQDGVGSYSQKSIYYSYDPVGRLTRAIQPNGKTLHYEYDDVGNLIQFSAQDGSINYRYYYDDLSRMVRADDVIQGYSIFRRYNDFNEVIEEAGGPGNLAIRSTFDLAGRRVGLILPDSSGVSYSYEGALLSSIQRFDAKRKMMYQHRYEYEPTVGKLSRQQLIGSLGSIDYHWDSKNRPVEIRSPWWSETIPLDGYDEDQHLTKFKIEDPAGETSYCFSYQRDHQLSGEVGHVNHSYEHDSLHNRISYDDKPWLVNELNQLIKAPGIDCEYDLNGNLIKKVANGLEINFEYDPLNRLIRVTKERAIAIQYTYDPFHRRAAQQRYIWNGEKGVWTPQKKSFFLLDGDKDIGKVDEQGKIQELRILGLGKGAEVGSAVAIELGHEIYVPIHDHQGSVRCLVDMRTRNVAEFYRYSAFGQEEIFDSHCRRLDQSDVGNPWRFSSKRTEDATSLVSFGKRDYDASIGRWMTTDPLSFFDGPNLYAFVKNDPLTHHDLYGLYAEKSWWDTVWDSIFGFWNHLEESASGLGTALKNELQLSDEFAASFEVLGDEWLGYHMMVLLGCRREQACTGVYGEKEINSKVRVTFINGILTTHDTLIECLDLISKSHGGVKVHYVFRPSEGFTWDVDRGLMLKFGYELLGFRSKYAHMLADMWRGLIEEMGGVGGGGTIIHYAHSMGGTETDRARGLLTPEEQKMIRVITFGTLTIIRNHGFQSVVNHICVNDGVATVLDPFGLIRNFFDPSSNVVWDDEEFFPLWRWPWNHLLCGAYRPAINESGRQFLIEFAPR